VVIAAVLAAPPSAAVTDPIAHDPTLIKQGAWYYDVITGDAGTRTYLPVRRSQDLIHRESPRPVFTTPPAWVPPRWGVTPVDFWAPDITRAGSEYRLYWPPRSRRQQLGDRAGDGEVARSREPGLRLGGPRHGAALDPGVDDFNAIDPDSGMPSAADPAFYPLATRQAPGAVGTTTASVGASSPPGDGFVRIVNQRSGRVFDVVGTDVQLWDADPTRRRQFAVRPAGRVLLTAPASAAPGASNEPSSATPRSPLPAATAIWRPTAGSCATATGRSGCCCPRPTAPSA
jgi:hypothetical protein